MSRDLFKRMLSAFMATSMILYPFSTTPIFAEDDVDSTEVVEDEGVENQETSNEVDETETETEAEVEKERTFTYETKNNDDEVTLSSEVTLENEIESKDVSLNVSESSVSDDTIEAINKDASEGKEYKAEAAKAYEVSFEKDGEDVDVSSNEASVEITFSDDQLKDVIGKKSVSDVEVYRVDDDEVTLLKDASVEDEDESVVAKFTEDKKMVTYVFVVAQEKKSETKNEAKSSSSEAKEQEDTKEDSSEKETETPIEESTSKEESAPKEESTSKEESAPKEDSTPKKEEKDEDPAISIVEEGEATGTLKIVTKNNGANPNVTYTISGDTLTKEYSASEVKDGISLDVGKYTVSQAFVTPNGYIVKNMSKTQTVTIEQDATETLTFTNTFEKKPDKATLRVKADASGIDTSKLSDVVFTVHGQNNYSKNYKYVDIKGNGISENVTSGEYSISVSNENINGYNCSISTSEPVTLKNGDSQTLNVQLSYQHKVGTLVISNAFESNDDSKGKTFEYSVQIGSVNKTYKIESGSSVSIENIKTGTRFSVVEKNSDENITVLVNGVEASTFNGVIAEGNNVISFVNREAETKNLIAVLRANVTLDNKEPKDNQFTFILKDKDGNVVQTVKNSKSKVTFDPITFSKEGTYVYTISQSTKTDSSKTSKVASNNPFAVYADEPTVINVDNSVYKETITVVKKDGKLTATAKIEKDGKPVEGVPTFKNVTRNSTPHTGTQTNALTYAIVIAIAAIAIIVLVRRNKKQ